MNSPRARNLVLALLALAALLFIFGFLAGRYRGEQTALAPDGTNLTAALEAEKARAWDAEQRARELEAELAALRAAQEKSSSTSDAALVSEREAARESAVAARAQAQVARDEAIQALAQSPQYQRAVAIEQQAEFLFRYSSLLRDLNLPKETQDKLLALMVDRQRIGNDIELAARTQGVTAGDGNLESLINSARQEIDGNIRVLLGDEAFAELQNYQRSLNQRADINQIQMAVTHAGVPLTGTQLDALLTAARQAPASDGGPRRGGLQATVPGGRVAISAQTLGAARSVLTPAQIQALIQLQQQQRAGNAVEQMEKQAGARD